MEERIFGGKFFRPLPKIHFDPNLGTSLFVTPWGDPTPGEQVIEQITNFMSLNSGDSEVTVPYPKKRMMSPEGNTLRMGIILASEKISKQYNKDEYISGFEILACQLSKNKLTYISSGQPNLLYCKPKKGLFPLNVNHDLNFQSSPIDFLSPLPNYLLGIDQHPPLNFGSQIVEPGDFCIAISRSYLPTELFSTESSQLDLNTISNILAKDSADTPFWLGLIHFE